MYIVLKHLIYYSVTILSDRCVCTPNTMQTMCDWLVSFLQNMWVLIIVITGYVAMKWNMLLQHNYDL